MRRVVVTGMGIVSCIGNSLDEVRDSLKNGKSGIRFNETYKEMGFRSQIAGSVDVDTSVIDRKIRRFMGPSAMYSFLSMEQAIAQAGLTEELISNDRTGLIAGSGGASCSSQVEATDIMRERGVKRIGPYMVPRIMTSTVSACLATAYKIRGVNYSMSSACATSAHCIGHAMEQIQAGKQDIVFAGGGEEEDWSLTMMFDAMGALSTKYNEHQHPGWRCCRDGRGAFNFWFRHPRHFIYQITDRPLPWCCRCAGGDLLAPDAAEWLHCRHQKPQRSGRENQRHAVSWPEKSRRRTEHRDVQQFRLWWD